MRLDQNGGHPRPGRLARQFDITKSPLIDIRSAMYVEIHGALQKIRQVRH